MKLELEFGKELCFTPTFRINNIEADSSDFGVMMPFRRRTKTMGLEAPCKPLLRGFFIASNTL